MKRYIALILLFALAAPVQGQGLKGLFHKKKEVAADTVAGLKRIEEVMGLLSKQYVTDPNTDKLSEDVVRHMLRTLDPHSIYIPAKEDRKSVV